MSDEADRRMAADLGKHAAEQMQEVLNRHMKLIQDVLPPPMVTMVLLNIANGVALGTMLYAMQMMNDDADAEDLWRNMAAAFPRLLDAGKPAMMAEFAKRRRAQAHG